MSAYLILENTFNTFQCFFSWIYHIPTYHTNNIRNTSQGSHKNTNNIRNSSQHKNTQLHFDSLSKLRRICGDNLKLEASGVLLGLSIQHAKPSNTFSRYTLWDNQNFPIMLNFYIKHLLDKSNYFVSNSLLLNKDFSLKFS